MADDDDLEADWRAVQGLPPPETIGDRYGPAMRVQTDGEAALIFERLVTSTMARGRVSRSEAERLERANLGYYSGYYNLETQQRVERLFRAVHPIFGPTSGPAPSANEVLRAGIQAGERSRRSESPHEALRAGIRTGERSRRSESPLYCEHANEMPSRCPCPADCYCKFNSCRSGA